MLPILLHNNTRFPVFSQTRLPVQNLRLQTNALEKTQLPHRRDPLKKAMVAVIAPSGTSVGSCVIAMPACHTCSIATRASVASENSMRKVKSTEIMT